MMGETYRAAGGGIAAREEAVARITGTGRRT